MKIKKKTLEKVFEIGFYPLRIVVAIGLVIFAPIALIIYGIIYDHENMDFKQDVIGYLTRILETLLIEVE
jgi:hypothetical protein